MVSLEQYTVRKCKLGKYTTWQLQGKDLHFSSNQTAISLQRLTEQKI